MKKHLILETRLSRDVFRLKTTSISDNGFRTPYVQCSGLFLKSLLCSVDCASIIKLFVFYVFTSTSTSSQPPRNETKAKRNPHSAPMRCCIPTTSQTPPEAKNWYASTALSPSPKLFVHMFSQARQEVHNCTDQHGKMWEYMLSYFTEFAETFKE